MYKVFFVVTAAIFYVNSALAGVVVSSTTRISEINAYANFPNGDVLIKVDAPHANCANGYWIQVTDLGFKQEMSMLLSAFQAQSNVVLYADDAGVWPYSPTPYCRITQVILKR